LCPKNSIGYGTLDNCFLFIFRKIKINFNFFIVVNDKTISCHNTNGGGINSIGWQSSFQNLRDRLDYMLLNDSLADVYNF
jgi:hypothetical protein